MALEAYVFEVLGGGLQDIVLFANDYPELKLQLATLLGADDVEEVVDELSAYFPLLKTIEVILQLLNCNLLAHIPYLILISLI